MVGGGDAVKAKVPHMSDEGYKWTLQGHAAAASTRHFEQQQGLANGPYPRDGVRHGGAQAVVTEVSSANNLW